MQVLACWKLNVFCCSRIIRVAHTLYLRVLQFGLIWIVVTWRGSIADLKPFHRFDISIRTITSELTYRFCHVIILFAYHNQKTKIYRLCEQRERLKKQLEKTKNQKEKLESLCRSLQAERKQSSIEIKSSEWVLVSIPKCSTKKLKMIFGTIISNFTVIFSFSCGFLPKDSIKRYIFFSSECKYMEFYCKKYCIIESFSCFAFLIYSFYPYMNFKV